MVNSCTIALSTAGSIAGNATTSTRGFSGTIEDTYLMSKIVSSTPSFIGPYNPDDEKCIAHIYDGGIYDNLGTEEFLQTGIGELKKSNNKEYK